MAVPGAHGKDKQRCGARVRTRRKWNGAPGTCLRWPVDGLFGKCHLHGGKSTGPKSPEGKARVVAAMVEGRKRWLAKLKAEGKKVPCGRSAKKLITKLKEEAAAAKRPRRHYNRNRYDDPGEEFCFAPDPTPAQKRLPQVNFIRDPRVAQVTVMLREIELNGD